MKKSAPLLALLAQAVSVTLHAAPVLVPAGAPIPFVALPSGLQPQVQSGSDLVTWSNGAFDGNCANVGGVVMFANTGIVPTAPPGSPQVGGTGYAEQWMVCTNGAVFGTQPEAKAAYLASNPSATATDIADNVVRVAASHTLPTQSITVDDTTGQFQIIRPSGNLVAGGVSIASTMTGGTMQVNNLRVDLVNKTVTADLVGTRSAAGTNPAIAYSAPNTVVWTFTSVQGPAALTPTDLLRSDRDAVLTAQGYAINTDGSIQAVHRLVQLQMSSTALTFVGNALGYLTLAKQSLSNINSDAKKWGDMMLTTTLYAPSAQELNVQAGQTAATPFNLSNGVSLRISLVSASSALDVLPSSYNTAAPALSMQGLLPWFNVFAVNPTAFPGGVGGSYPVLDPRFTAEQFEGQTRTRIRTTSVGSQVSFNNQSGVLVGLGGYRFDMVGDFLNSAMGGGLWSAQNIYYILAQKSALADLSGTLGAIGSTPPQDVPAQYGTNIWTYTNLTGPTTLPLQSLAAATSVTALPAVLQNAGFVVNSVTSSAITFTGTYKFTGINVLPVLKDYMCLALACTAQAKRALQGGDTDYLGQFTTNVKFSLPLTPAVIEQ